MHFVATFTLTSLTTPISLYALSLCVSADIDIGSKLHLMQLQLWSDTYDARNTQALAEISREQQQMEQQLRSAIQQVCCVYLHCVCGGVGEGSMGAWPVCAVRACVSVCA